MLANSDKKHDLIDHLETVALVSRAMAEYLGLSKDLVEACYWAGRLHDIGKATGTFQESLTKPTSIIGPLHNEISWAYVVSKIRNDWVANAIYWHHSRCIRDDGGYYHTQDEILEGLDLTGMDSVWALKEPNYPSSVNSGAPISVPDMYYPDKMANSSFNSELLVVRGVVTSADRYVSHTLSAEEVADIASGKVLATGFLKGMVSGGVLGTPVCPSGYDSVRYDMQAQCAMDAVASTTIVRAPAGLGKTIVGILWGLRRGGKVIWVCPRNAVADAVYRNIKKELQNLGLSCSVELYLTGKRKEIEYINTPIIVDDNTENEFSADIIVTNIDNVLSPMVNNRVGGRLFLTLGSNVVLDEFHEFVSDAPLFAAFITYMRARHRVASQCHTILLSATPSCVHKMWDTEDKRTLQLPDATGHYAPAHTVPYDVVIHTKSPVVIAKGYVAVSNAVKTAQELYLASGATYLIHHGYTDADRKALENNIYTDFGPGGTSQVGTSQVGTWGI